ncbi:MAG: segregation ATPase FtsK/SpoIIIE, family, partial [Gaiellaceae bacterium]|nr:segregation ATPase FtsK/SpoIIIE, family [Gaiellaceae bacterium]
MDGETALMAPRRKKKRTLKPRLPARVRTKKRKSKTKSQQHPELIGLGLLALGVFLASVLYLGWSGGMVGGWIADGFRAAIGSAAYVAPVAFVAVGALMVARSSLVDVKPFRTGLAVTSFGLLAALGSSHGGATGRGLEGIFGLLVGSTGTT